MHSKIYRLFPLLLTLLITPLVNADLLSKPRSLDLYGLQVEGTTSQDGSLMAFVIEPDRQVSYVRETSPGSGSWGPRKEMDIYANQIALGKHADGRITLFNIGTLGNVLYSVTQSAPNSDNWMPEIELKGAYAMQIEAMTEQDGRLSLYFLDMGREIGRYQENASNSATWGKPELFDLNGNRFEVGMHADGSPDIAIIGTMAGVISHATLGEGGNWIEEEIKGTYGYDIELVNADNEDLRLFIVQPDKEIVHINLSQDTQKRHNLDMYGLDVAAKKTPGGTIQLFIIGTMANVLSNATQLAPDSDQWGKELDMKGYARHLSPVSNDSTMTLFTVAPFMSEVMVYQ